MNNIILMGRLTKDPEIRYCSGKGKEEQMAVAHYSIAVNRKFKREGEPDADFFNCTSFGKTAEFVGKYLQKRAKVLIRGSVQNNNYTNSEGKKMYNTQVIVDEIEEVEFSRKNKDEEEK